jgi:DnaJ-class molecular chaperone
MKDYYTILQVNKSSSEEEIRKSYRKMAMQHHPDRNPDNPHAEKIFIEITEAYGVLTDPVKRRKYDRLQAGGKTGFSCAGNASEFSYSQEDIFRDLFKDPRFQQMFQGLLHEFRRSGFRSSSNFVKKSFFNGKGSMFLGGIFLFGSIAGPVISKASRTISANPSLLKSVTDTVGSLLGFGQQKNACQRTDKQKIQRQSQQYNTTYHTPLTAAEMAQGKTIQVIIYTDGKEQTLKVKIPPGSKDGQKLRIKNKGGQGPHGRGDLYLNLVQRE